MNVHAWISVLLFFGMIIYIIVMIPVVVRKDEELEEYLESQRESNACMYSVMSFYNEREELIADRLPRKEFCKRVNWEFRFSRPKEEKWRAVEELRDEILAAVNGCPGYLEIGGVEHGHDH